MIPATAAIAAGRHAIKAIAALAVPLGLVLLLGLAGMAQARAQERILSYDSVIEVRADGSLDITEDIRVRAEGSNIRRGIYRDFPTRYQDRLGNRVMVGFEVLGVQRDDRPEPWFTERHGNGVRVNTGNDDFLQVPADYTYTLHYRTTRQLGFFDDHDELYFNAIGTGWDFAIERASVEVRLPQPVPVAKMEAQGYTGDYGSTARAFDTALPAPGVARWTLTQPLRAGEGMTVVLSFPKGIVVAPTRPQRIWWLLKDNSAALIALAGLAALLFFCVVRWRQVGRDPPPGVVVVRYEPPREGSPGEGMPGASSSDDGSPDAYSPAELRFVRRMGYDNRCFSSELLAGAVDGQLRIHRDKQLLSDTWRLERLAGAEPPAGAGQRLLLEKLFADGPELELTSKSAAPLRDALARHAALLEKRFNPRLFTRHAGSIALAILIVALTALLTVGVGMIWLESGGLLLVVPIALAMLAIAIAFGVLVKAPTAEGRRLLDAIEGFRRYLGVAERDELGALQGPGAPPPLDAARYERLLPYAVALDVEEAWTKKFTFAVGAAAAAATTAAIGWYQGGRVDSLGSLSQAIGGSLASQIASSATPPGSASGGGGGGFSGGGGGGGGGGGR